MKDLTIDQRLSFLNDLELASATVPGNQEPSSEEEKSASVDAGSVMSFVAKVGLQHRQDALNSTLLAQMAANAAHSRVDDPVAWYQKYLEVMETVGWVIQSFNFTKFETKSASFAVDTMIIELLAALMTENEALVLEEAIAALKALSDGAKQSKIFETSSHDLKKANAQIGVASDESGVMVMKIAFFYLHSSQQMTRVLWFDFKSADSDLFKSAQTINLNEQIYGPLREAVIKKLGDRAAKYIDELPLGD